MGHLREEVVHDVGADVVVDLVEDAVVPVNGRQPPAEVAPLLHAIELVSDTKTAPTQCAGAPLSGRLPAPGITWHSESKRQAPSMSCMAQVKNARSSKGICDIQKEIKARKHVLSTWDTLGPPFRYPHQQSWVEAALTSPRYQGIFSLGSWAPWWCR